MAKLLTTIPGIGYYSALFLVSEIDDITDFLTHITSVRTQYIMATLPRQEVNILDG